MEAQVLSPGVAMSSVPSNNSSSTNATSTFNPVSGSTNGFNNAINNPNGINQSYTGTPHSSGVNLMVDTSSYSHNERQQSNYLSNHGDTHSANGHHHAMGKF